MILADIFFWIFAIASAMYVVHLGIYLIGANLYDMWQHRRVHRRNHNIGQPLVTVLVPAHNEEKVVERCLESIRRNTYKNIQIVVVNDASTDQTLRILRRYKRRHPELTLTVASTPKNTGKGGALNYALRRFAKGDLVMSIDADSMIARSSIAHAITYFDDPTVAGVAANVRIIDETTTLGTLQKLEHMIGYRSKKVYSLINCEFVIGGVASTYRMDILQKVGFYDVDTLTEDIGLSMKVIGNGNRQYRLVYAADVKAMTEGVSTYGALFKQRYRWKYGSLQNLIKHRRLIGKMHKNFTPALTIYRLPVAILSEFLLLITPFLWGYIAYVSIATHNPFLIIGAYCTTTLYVLITLWFDEHASFRKRLALSHDAIFAYLIFYIMDIVQIFSASRCVYKIKSLLHQKDIGSVWVSPARAGDKGA